MSRRPLRIGLFGLFGVRNLGNEATLAATVANLRARAPDAELILVSSPPAAGADLPEFPVQIEPDLLPVMYRPWRFVPSRWKGSFGAFMQRITEPLRRRRTRRAARALDMLLIAGTGIADDFGQGPYDAPHHLARWCEVVRAQGGRVCFASIGAGPASHPLARRWFGDALRAANYRSYRELSSRKFAQEIGVDVAADPVLPDLVFSLPIDASISGRAVDWPPRSIGLGVMGYRGWNASGDAASSIYKTYLDKIESLTRQLLDAGYRVHLLIGNRGGDRRPVADLRAAVASHPAAASLVAVDIQTHDDVLREIAATDLVIATRFHNVLKALRLGRPVISIGYARKNDDLMREMGLGQFCHGVEDFDPARVLEQVRAMASMPAPPVAQLSQRVTEYRQALASQFDQILATGGEDEG
jgi:polysaccharide pyruvyl transferase WcaK-like protein